MFPEGKRSDPIEVSYEETKEKLRYPSTDGLEWLNSARKESRFFDSARLEKGEWVEVPRERVVDKQDEEQVEPFDRTSRIEIGEENFVPLAEGRQLETLQGEVEVAPGVRIVPVGGHTAYHQMVVVEGGGETLVIPTDLLPTTSHLPLPYVMGYDLFPVGTLEAKRRLMKRVIEEKWRVLFYHDPRTPVGRVSEERGRFVLSEVTA